MAGKRDMNLLKFLDKNLTYVLSFRLLRNLASCVNSGPESCWKPHRSWYSYYQGKLCQASQKCSNKKETSSP